MGNDSPSREKSGSTELLECKRRSDHLGDSARLSASFIPLTARQGSLIAIMNGRGGEVKKSESETSKYPAPQPLSSSGPSIRYRRWVAPLATGFSRQPTDHIYRTCVQYMDTQLKALQTLPSF